LEEPVGEAVAELVDKSVGAIAGGENGSEEGGGKGAVPADSGVLGKGSIPGSCAVLGEDGGMLGLEGRPSGVMPAEPNPGSPEIAGAAAGDGIASGLMVAAVCPCCPCVEGMPLTVAPTGIFCPVPPGSAPLGTALPEAVPPEAVPPEAVPPEAVPVVPEVLGWIMPNGMLGFAFPPDVALAVLGMAMPPNELADEPGGCGTVFETVVAMTTNVVSARKNRLAPIR
jgi:hypothetical protein